MPDEFGVHFRREGVLHQVQKLMDPDNPICTSQYNESPLASASMGWGGGHHGHGSGGTPLSHHHYHQHHPHHHHQVRSKPYYRVARF